MKRTDLIAGKSELSDEELAELIDLNHEYADMSSLKKYTEKKFRDLSKNEKEELITHLLTDEPYIKYKNCWIAKSKLLYDASETLAKETAALSRLSDLGYEVYLLPYAYARDNMNFFQKSADSIVSGDFLEMKNVVSTGNRAGQSSYKASRLQADNVFLSFENEIDEKKAINNIYREIQGQKEESKKNNIEINFQGLVFLNFEKTNKTSLYKVSKDGFVQKLESAEFKKYKGTARDDSQVAADPMTEHGSLPDKNISQSAEKSTIEKQNRGKEKRLEKDEKILYKHAKVNVNGVVRECKNGLVEGFKNSVAKVDELRKENIELKNENQNLRQYIQNNIEAGVER